jgi:DNA-binding GntR family transcriptional regulator
MKKQKPTAQTIYESLKTMILHFDITPGSRITESQVADYFEVSRTPVRAALLRLETEGQLTIKSKQGCFIRNIDLPTISHYYDVRLELEAMALKLIASGRPANDLETLAADWEPEMQNFGGEVSEALMAAEEAFHVELAIISGNPVLVNYLKDVNEQIRIVRRMGWPNQQSVTDTYLEHHQICQLLITHQLDEALTELENHIRKSQDMANNISLKQIYGKGAVFGPSKLPG